MTLYPLFFRWTLNPHTLTFPNCLTFPKGYNPYGQGRSSVVLTVVTHLRCFDFSNSWVLLRTLSQSKHLIFSCFWAGNFVLSKHFLRTSGVPRYSWHNEQDFLKYLTAARRRCFTLAPVLGYLSTVPAYTSVTLWSIHRDFPHVHYGM